MAKPEPPKRAVIYARISKDPEGRELGVKRQEEDCRALAERLGLEVAAIYVDNDVSASTRSKKPRPQFEEMTQAAERGDFQAILAYSNSRLTRRPAEWNQLIDLHERHGVNIHTVASGSADLSRADGRAVARTIAAWDAAEAERISERVSRAKLQAAEDGRYHGGSRAFGWTSDLQVDPDEAKLVQEWAARVLRGESLKSLAKDMNTRGIPTVTGAAWSATVVKQILVNPRVAGWRTRHGDTLGKAVWEPLLDEGTWQAVCGVLSDPSRDKATRARVHLLTSLAVCGYCEKPVGMSASSTTRPRPDRPHLPPKRILHRRYHCADCGMYRAIGPVDARVTGYMVGLLTNMEDVSELDVPKDSKAAELRQRIRNNVIRFAESDVMSDSDFETMQRRLQARLEREEAKLAVPRRQRLILGMTGPDAAARWEAAPLDRKRQIIDAFIEVRLYRGRPGGGSFDPATVELLDR